MGVITNAPLTPLPSTSDLTGAQPSNPSVSIPSSWMTGPPSNTTLGVATGSPSTANPQIGTAQPGVGTAVSSPQSVVSGAANTASGDTPDTVTALINAAAQPNPLNDFYQSSYHFRLFTAGDLDIIQQAGDGNISINVLSAIAGGSVPQITIVETGVTGFNITEVDIETVEGQEISYQSLTEITMTVVDPLGVSFLDGLYQAAVLAGMKNYTKGTFYLELTFTGYNTDGTWEGQPLNILSNLPNGGRWIWAVQIKTIRTKINEGGGVFTLTLVVINGLDLLNESQDILRVPSTLTVSGVTIQDILDDFVTKVNIQWSDVYGGDTSKPLVRYQSNNSNSHAIQTHPVIVGSSTAIGKNPGNFILQGAKQEFNTERAAHFDNSGPGGMVSCQLTQGTSVHDFILAVIKNTEEGQALAKDVATTEKVDPTPQQWRETAIFSIEPDIMIVGFDQISNQYTKQITIHVVPHISYGPILSNTQRDNAVNNPTTQQAIIQAMIQKGFLKKKYDYIFTGKNTEVIDVDINWEMAWSAMLPKMAGANMGIDNVAINSRLGPSTIINPVGNRQEAAQQLQVQSVTVTGDTSGLDTSSGLITPGSSSWMKSVLNSQQQSLTTPSAAASNAATPQTALASGVPNPQIVLGGISGNGLSGNTYIEDVLDQENNVGTTEPSPLPVSFWQAYENVVDKAGQGMTGQYHRDKSITGAIYAQIATGRSGVGFQEVDLTIRGDPFWLGQTNLERKIILRNGLPTYDPSPSAQPDHVSGGQYFYLYFRYPLQLGNDFKPILTNSEVFNCIYRVTNVKHTFSEGVFKQVLHGAVYPLIIPLSNSQNPNIGNNGESLTSATGTGAAAGGLT